MFPCILSSISRTSTKAKYLGLKQNISRSKSPVHGRPDRIARNIKMFCVWNVYAWYDTDVHDRGGGVSSKWTKLDKGGGVQKVNVWSDVFDGWSLRLSPPQSALKNDPFLISPSIFLLIRALVSISRPWYANMLYNYRPISSYAKKIGYDTNLMFMMHYNS